MRSTDRHMKGFPFKISRGGDSKEAFTLRMRSIRYYGNLCKTRKGEELVQLLVLCTLFKRSFLFVSAFVRFLLNRNFCSGPDGTCSLQRMESGESPEAKTEAARPSEATEHQQQVRSHLYVGNHLNSINHATNYTVL